MSNRRYNLLCPISRALDRLGDRWSLLILRDLHAGPVRYKHLAEGLTGVPSNLLALRLKELIADGLIQKTTSEHGVPLYELTDIGEATAPLLFELAKFGTHFPADEEPKTPGNLRLAAVTLKEALSRVARDAELNLELRIEGQPFAIVTYQDRVSVRYGAAPDPLAVISVPYEPMVAYADGTLTKEDYAQYVEVTGSLDAANQFMQLLEQAMTID